ncbi:MAG: YqgE/AlgH family protein [Opitutales bacterium]
MQERSGQHESLAGQLLVSHPRMLDPNFHRTVVLLSAHDAESALGVVLNRPLPHTLGSHNPSFALTPLAAVPLYQGGPVEQDKLVLVAWHTRSQTGEFELQFGLEPERASAMADVPGVTVRGFLGYAGWGRGQLEKEMRHHTWFTAPAASYNLGAAEGTALWRMVLGSLNPELKLYADEPDDPSRN